MKAPAHDNRIKGPKGSNVRPKGAIVHCTVSYPRPGPSDRHGIIDYLVGKGISVPAVNDDESTTLMMPLGYLGYGHAASLTGKAWGIEQIGQASWSRKEWMRHEKTVRSSAQWGAFVLAELMDLAVTVKHRKEFIVGHDQDYKLGGTSDHWDPGPNYPWDVFDDELVKFGKVQGYRVVATKDDKKKVREFKKENKNRMKNFTKKWADRGWKIARRKQWLKADFDGWD